MATRNTMDMSEMDPDGPWKEPWEANLWRPGPGRSGTLIGHLIPGGIFFVLSLIMLLFSLWRAQKLPAGQSFSETHIPEKNPVVLKRRGIVLIFAAIGSLTYDIVGEILHGAEGYHPRAHEAMDLAYLAMGYIDILESQNRLPVDSGRMALVVAQIIQGIAWWEHAEIKLLFADRRIHYYLSAICFAGAAIVAYSIRNPGSTVAYIGGWMAILLQAQWLVVAGIYMCCIEMPMVGTWFAYNLLFQMVVVSTVVAYCGTGQKNKGSGTYPFSPIKVDNYAEVELYDEECNKPSCQALM